MPLDLVNKLYKVFLRLLHEVLDWIVEVAVGFLDIVLEEAEVAVLQLLFRDLLLLFGHLSLKFFKQTCLLAPYIFLVKLDEQVYFLRWFFERLAPPVRFNDPLVVLSHGRYDGTLARLDVWDSHEIVHSTMTVDHLDNVLTLLANHFGYPFGVIGECSCTQIG